VAAQCKPLLKKFQTNAPLAPCLYDEIWAVIVYTYETICQEIDYAEGKWLPELLKIDVTNKDTRCNYNEVNA